MNDTQGPKYSQEMAHLERSVMRDLLSLAVDPEIISFAGGLPASDALPLAEYRQCLNRVLERDGASALQYSPQWGPLKEWLADWMEQRGVQCQPDQVFITNGAQQGLAILSRLFLDPGDPAVIENIVFTGIQQVTKGRGAAVRPVEVNSASGVRVSEFERALSKAPRPRLAVLVPSFHNPLSATIPVESRRAIAELAARYSVPLVEDDPYSPLHFEGELAPPIKAFDEAGLVFYLGSFSKLLAPAVRLGWMVVPEAHLPQITVVRESLDLESSTLTQRAVAEFLVGNGLKHHLEEVRSLHRTRCQAMLAALDQHLGEHARWTQPQGGLFIWLTLAEGLDSWQLFERAVERKVAYIPGSAFAVDGGSRNTMRLNFSNANPNQIEEGVSRLAQVILAAEQSVA
jgi:2-aminoadipate transaminase